MVSGHFIYMTVVKAIGKDEERCAAVNCVSLLKLDSGALFLSVGAVLFQENGLGLITQHAIKN